MTPARRVLIFSAVVLLGVWGCARGPSTKNATTQRVKLLEARCAKLEDDYRTVANTRDRLRRQMTAVHQDRAGLEQELQEATNTVSSVEKQCAETKTKHEQLLAQHKSMKQELEQLLAQRSSLERELQTNKKRMLEMQQEHKLALAAVEKAACEEVKLAKQESELMFHRSERLKRGLEVLLGEDESIYSTKTSTQTLPVMSFAED